MRPIEHAGPFQIDRALVVRDRPGRWTPEFRALRTSMGLPA